MVFETHAVTHIRDINYQKILCGDLLITKSIVGSTFTAWVIIWLDGVGWSLPLQLHLQLVVDWYQIHLTQGGKVAIGPRLFIHPQLQLPNPVKQPSSHITLKAKNWQKLTLPYFGAPNSPRPISSTDTFLMFDYDEKSEIMVCLCERARRKHCT